MLRKILLSSMLIAGMAGTAMAAPLTVTSEGENFHVEYSNDGGNILGGGPVQVIGRGQTARYLHAPDAPAQRGWYAEFQGQGESGAIVYVPAPGTDMATNPHPQG
ncbi:hypothetical protein [Roseomonas sp. KE0001]|uniref:hypothetical protein n=1 Tax=unclassified Roseomonas TaxID=2617492 RepID=UPI0018DF61E2|nr:hypothetical protein [Roseomonas sp. KE0001]MBI0432955.1 hypothetical protein [Roseomonas sp. KE0001]